MIGGHQFFLSTNSNPVVDYFGKEDRDDRVWCPLAATATIVLGNGPVPLSIHQAERYILPKHALDVGASGWLMEARVDSVDASAVAPREDAAFG
jgi:hypothetical protein